MPVTEHPVAKAIATGLTVIDPAVAPEGARIFNRQERRDAVRSLRRHVRLAYGFGRWRGPIQETHFIRTDGQR